MADQDYTSSIAGGALESEAEATRTTADVHRRWMMALDLADKEEKSWRDAARKAINTYRDENDKGERSRNRDSGFNILWSNTELMRPAIYARPPEPDIRRRYRDENPIGRAAAEMLERALSYCMDAYDADHVLEQAVLDYVLPGRAVVRCRYSPVIVGEKKSYEEATWQHWPWQRFRRGPGGSWEEVPWIAYEHVLSKDEIAKEFGAEVAGEISLDIEVNKGGDGSYSNVDRDQGEHRDIWKRGRVWEIWNKDDREIVWVAPSIDRGPIKVEADRLELEGFFDTPRPMYAIESPDSLVPIEEYRLYRDQAEELTDVTRRIRRLVRALKVRGLYDSTLKEMDKVMSAGDNELTPAAGGITTLSQTGGLENHIWLFPIETVARVLLQLYQQRDQIKQVIYEIVGLSDILRGSSDPNETLGAQQIKAQSGSLRLDRRRKEVQRYARDLIRIKAEIISEHFSAETLAIMTGTELPKVEQSLALLKLDGPRGFMIDIETDSTVAEDVAADQSAMSEMLGGIASYVQSVGPAVEAGYLPLEAATSILMAALRRFKLGRQVEMAIEDASNPQQGGAMLQQQPDPAQQQAAMQEQQAAQAEAAKLQMDMQRQQADAQLKAQQQEIDAQFKAQDLTLRERETALKEAEFGFRQEMERIKAQFEYAKIQDGVVARQEARTDAGVEAGLPIIDQFIATQDQQIQALPDALMQLAQAIAQGQEDQRQRDEALIAMLTAPKEVIFDERGRPIGVQTVTQA